MAYLRWSGSDWYVFAHCDGGLAVWSRFARNDCPVIGDDQVRRLLDGREAMDWIPGWRQSSISERQELLWAMREYVADEAGENLFQIGDGDTPSMRQLLRSSREQDKDADCYKANVPDASDS